MINDIVTGVNTPGMAYNRIDLLTMNSKLKNSKEQIHHILHLSNCLTQHQLYKNLVMALHFTKLINLILDVAREIDRLRRKIKIVIL